MKKTLIFIIFILLATGCETPLHLSDNYYIHPEDEFVNGYYLFCNPSCENDVFIQYIKEVQWNKKYIIVETLKEEWFVIKALGPELFCCNNDSLLGPMSVDSIEKYKFKENIKYLKKKEFTYQFKDRKKEKNENYKLH